MEFKYCPNCDSEKSTEDFGLHKGRRDGLQDYCIICKRKKGKEYRDNNPEIIQRSKFLDNKKRRKENKSHLSSYLLNHPCVDCGETDIAVLEFDHVRDTKSNNISRMMGSNTWKTILKEISKCEVRCANCHRRKTLKERGIKKDDTLLLR